MRSYNLDQWQEVCKRYEIDEMTNEEFEHIRVIRRPRFYDGAKLDVFSVGVIAFWLRTGKYPFREPRKHDPGY